MLEIMVVLTIIGVSYGMGMHFLTKPKNTQTSIADPYFNGLNYARTKAIENNEVFQFSLTEDNGWRVTRKKTGKVMDERAGPGPDTVLKPKAESIRQVSFNGLGMVTSGEDLTNFMQHLDVMEAGAKTFHRINIPVSGQMRIAKIDPEAKPAP